MGFISVLYSYLHEKLINSWHVFQRVNGALENRTSLTCPNVTNGEISFYEMSNVCGVV